MSRNEGTRKAGKAKAAVPAKKRARKAAAKMGRPTAYRPEYAKETYKLCLLGATDAQLGDFFGVDERTINRWAHDHEDFCRSRKRGKQEADARVAQSLYHRALGYEHEAVKITTHAESGFTTETPYVERYPPDTTAAIFWLKNRRPDVWRDRHEMQVDARMSILEQALDELEPESDGD